MTLRQIARIVARRWYVTLATLALAAVVATIFLQAGGVYSTRATVEFRWPGAARIEADSGFTNDSVISFADMVARRVNGGHETQHYSQDDAPLYGIGLREAQIVGVKFSGNQWITDHPIAEVTVQVVGLTEAEVRAKQQSLLAEVGEVADGLQREVGVSPNEFVVQSLNPLSQTIEYVGPTSITKAAAFGALAVAGLVSGVGLALVGDRAWAHRRSRRSLSNRRGTL